MRLMSAGAVLAAAFLTSACNTVGGNAELKDIALDAAGSDVQPVTAVFVLGGASAKGVYDKLTLVAETDVYGGNRTFYGQMSLVCTRTNGGLPPGPQSFPALTTFRCGMGAMIPPGVQGFPPPPFLKVDGAVARELFNVMAVGEVDEGSTGTKSFMGSAAFYCGYTLDNGVRTNDYCRMTADE